MSVYSSGADMSLAQLLQNLGSYLDFSKRLATTVPGIVMAFAIVLLTGSVPEWASRIYACGEYRWTQRSTLALSDGVDSRSSSKVRLIRSAVLARRREYATALQNLTACAAGCDAAIAAATMARKSLDEACTLMEVPTDAHCQELTTFAEPSQAEKPSSPQSTQPGSDRNQQSLSNDERALLTANDDFGRAAAATQCRTPVSWSDVVNGVLLFGVLGFAFGVVLDPISKALFLETLPEASNRVTDLFVSRERRRFKVNAVLPQYAIGRGLITDAEYQGLIDAYFRFSEVTIGLVLPTLAIGAALAFRRVAVSEYIGAAVMGLGALVVAILLSRIGTRRHVEFKAKVAQLIRGRSDRIQEQKQQERRRVDLTALQVLVHEAARLRDRHKSE